MRPLYDYFMGTALNPPIGPLDIKLFCEARPGMIFWLLLNLSMAAKPYEVMGTVTGPILLVVGFQSFYPIDYFLQEEAVLTTWISSTRNSAGCFIGAIWFGCPSPIHFRHSASSTIRMACRGRESPRSWS
ncbi:MAG: ERG4/ERG24 family protein [Chromatiales bacterium]|nr:ERG4/ERG24 family protein [Chromatiales bacterium]